MNEAVKSSEKDIMNKPRKIFLTILYITVGSLLLFFSTKLNPDFFWGKFVSAIGEAFLVLGFVEFALQPYIANLINTPTSIEKKYIDFQGKLNNNLKNIDGILDTAKETVAGVEKDYKELQQQMLSDKIDFISQDLEITKQYILEIRDAVINKNSLSKDRPETM